MIPSAAHKYDPFAAEMFTWLHANPDKTIDQIQHHLNEFAKTMTVPPKKIPGAYAVIYYTRSVLGPDVVVCNGRRGATYHVAVTRADGMTWVHARKRNVRNQIARTIKNVTDIETRYGADKDLTLVKASLQSALLILDATGPGAGTATAV